MSEKTDALGILKGLITALEELDENDSISVNMEVTNSVTGLNPMPNEMQAIQNVLDGNHQATIKVEWTNGAERSHARYEEARRGLA